MSSWTATMADRAAARWGTAKPIVYGVLAGLVAGPLLSGLAGFQVRTSTAEAATRAGILEQQASFCAERARASLAGAALPTDWQARSNLARSFAAMPGTANADPEVVFACSGKLAP
ncbi:hypothetical protein [Paracraurococcus ruber]|uniref:Uncharacterized protein n=1 Tax=Paracraurococcus ruber TaxID=77675 RepID=A0ABS1CZD2_9PROT|nr:hypothetical protein [Paracraurococcus ruber]MBK1659297.1 hypothetical protein [Paracraurococcus ruber]TDG32851.1 hypothetical protein E2C05_05740 [Paracraurococcus ruber]